MDPIDKRTIITANAPILVFPADPPRSGVAIWNPFTVPIFVSFAANPPAGPGSVRVPPANTAGDWGYYRFDGTLPNAIYAVCSATGDFTVQSW